MGAEEIRLSADRLRSSGNDLRRIGDRLGAGEDVAGGTEYWGADRPGTAFGTAYGEIASLIPELASVVRTAYDSAGGGLRLMGDNLESTETANTRIIDEAGEWV